MTAIVVAIVRLSALFLLYGISHELYLIREMLERKYRNA